jgi:hypothetical protein
MVSHLCSVRNTEWGQLGIQGRSSLTELQVQGPICMSVCYVSISGWTSWSGQGPEQIWEWWGSLTMMVALKNTYTNHMCWCSPLIPVTWQGDVLGSIVRSAWAPQCDTVLKHMIFHQCAFLGNTNNSRFYQSFIAFNVRNEHKHAMQY